MTLDSGKIELKYRKYKHEVHIMTIQMVLSVAEKDGAGGKAKKNPSFRWVKDKLFLQSAAF